MDGMGWSSWAILGTSKSLLNTPALRFDSSYLDASLNVQFTQSAESIAEALSDLLDTCSGTIALYILFDVCWETC